MNSLKLRFCPIDSLFFRELRPQGGPGGMPLQSLFPPPPRTFSGTIHNLLHEATGTAFVSADQRGGKITKGFENLRLRGPWLAYVQTDEHYAPMGPAMGPIERLYPWPLHILRHKKSGHNAPLTPAASAVLSDQGRIFLPHLGPGLKFDPKRYRPCTDTWLTETDFLALLANPHDEVPQYFGIVDEDDDDANKLPLLVRETRLGIGRDTASRSAADAQLYQTCHIRPVPQLVFDVELVASYSHKNGHSYTHACEALAKLEQALNTGCIVRLGSEGHSAHVSVVKTDPIPPETNPPLSKPPDGPPPKQVTLVFTTHADFGQDIHKSFAADWKPHSFTRCTDKDGAVTWRGFPDARSGVEVEIVSAVCGKYLREGGWDSTELKKDAQGKWQPDPGPRDARPLLPAGSMWFCRVLRGDARLLHGAQIGIGRELGRGEIAIGAWPTNQIKETQS